MVRRLLPVLLFVAAVYFSVLPLVRPRGPYVWGHHRLVDLYIGVPLLLAAIVAAAYAFDGSRPLARALLSIAISILLTVVILDVAYSMVLGGLFSKANPTDRWFEGTSIPREYNDPDNERGFIRKPGVSWTGSLVPGGRVLTYRTDERGYRNAMGITKADVVFIGDSFTEAASVPEDNTFVQVLGKRLGRSVVNLGTGYYCPQQELLTLQRVGLAYDPKVVVWQIFEGNDLTEASRFAEWQASPIQSPSVVQRYTSASLLTRVLGLTLPKDPGAPRGLRLPDGSTGTVELDYQYKRDEPATEALGWAETKKAIRDGFQLCRSRNIKLIVVFVPIKVRILAPYIVFKDNDDRDRYLPGGSDDSPDDFGRELAAYCSDLGCPFVDSTPSLKDRAAQDDRYVFVTVHDSHLDVDGHMAVADAVEKPLRAALGE